MQNILVIVEGKKAEPKFFEQIHHVFGLDFNICSLATNIYTLYKRIKDLDFECDIKQVLKEIHPEKSQMLDNKFVYTYLVFDCDAHHPKKDDNRDIKEIVIDNLSKIKEMLDYFNDETEPSKGKLYINFPMMESYRDADDFFDDAYQNTEVMLSDLGNYKSIVGNRKLSKRRIDSYTIDELSRLSKMNLFKLNKIVNNLWNSLSYSEYRNIMGASQLFHAEKNIVNVSNKISVINTTMFLVIDYFGNQNGFFDKIINT